MISLLFVNHHTVSMEPKQMCLLLFLIWFLPYILSYKNSAQIAIRWFSATVALYLVVISVCLWEEYIEFRIYLLHYLGQTPLYFQRHSFLLWVAIMDTRHFLLLLSRLLCPQRLDSDFTHLTTLPTEKLYIFQENVFALLGPYTYPDLPSILLHSSNCPHPHPHQLAWAWVFLIILQFKFKCQFFPHTSLTEEVICIFFAVFFFFLHVHVCVCGSALFSEKNNRKVR